MGGTFGVHHGGDQLSYNKRRCLRGCLTVRPSVCLCVCDSPMTHQTIKTEAVNFEIVFRMLIKIK